MKINEDTEVLSSWFCKHRLFPNLSNTKIICFGYKNNQNLREQVRLHAPPDCSCEPIGQVDKIKYLYVVLDAKMT